MRVWDTFMFGGELDMLECRLTEFDSLMYPVSHVITEAAVTHQGYQKPLTFKQNAARFKRWRNRIRYVVADQLPNSASPWDREHAQRDTAYQWAQAVVAPGDIVLHGDLDEIPRMSALIEAIQRAKEGGPVALVMRQFLYAVDWYHPNLDQALTVVARWETISSLAFTQLRAMMGSLPTIADAGWHLSWIGGPDANLAKLRMHCHAEMTDEERYWPESGRAYREGRTHGGVWQVPVESLDDYPVWVRERRCPPEWFRPRT